MKRIICKLPYCNDLGKRRCIICSAFISLRLKISFTTHNTASTHSAPRNGLSLVILWNVGINHNPPIPTNSIDRRCKRLRFVSSPRYGIAGHSTSSLAGRQRPIRYVGKAHAVNAGNARYAEKLVAVTVSSPHNITPAGSPITVMHPPVFAASTMAEPMSILCLLFCTIPCMMTSIMAVVVRLSRFAEIMNVATVMDHNRRLLFRVLIHSEMKSKHPLLFSISTIVIVASKNNTIAAAFPTYFRKILS